MEQTRITDILRRMRFLATPPVLIGVLLVICAGFGWVYYQHHQEQGELSAETALVDGRLQQPQPRIEDLEQELAGAEGETEATLASFPADPEVTDIIRAILRSASQTSVAILSIQPGSGITEEVGESSYPVLNFSLAVQGSFSQLMAFTRKLEEETFDMLVLEQAAIAEGEETSSLSLSFSVYCRPAGL